MIRGQDEATLERGQRILVTGAAGFVGRHLVAHLLESDSRRHGISEDSVQIFAATHSNTASAERPMASALTGWQPEITDPRITVVGIDISDRAAISALIAEIRPDQIYHLAARASGADTDRQGVFAVNVTGTANLLSAAASLNPAPRVLLTSTGYIYGNTDPKRPAREGDPISAPGRYGAYTDSKIEMESIARAYRDLALIVRPFGHTGAGHSPLFAVPSFARQLARIEGGLAPPELLVGNLDASRDLLDVRDVVRAYCLALCYGTPGDVFNVGQGHPQTIRAILQRLCALCAIPVTLRIDPARLRAADIVCSTGDSTLLRDQTGWQPHYTLDDTLAATLDYWRAQPG